MVSCAHPCHGAPTPPGEGSIASPKEITFRKNSAVRRTGFTLLEMCMVLFIIALLAGLSMPAMQSAFTERAVRNDTHQLALMVKTAMIQSAEQHRTYVIDLTDTTMALYPEGETPADADASASTNDDDAAADGSSAPEDVEISGKLDPPNQLLAPDPLKADAWNAMPPDTQWIFEPGELCPATRVRLKRGDAWLEMSFNALTGNVENERTYFP
jgi:prepilin-type N-terminal cleavage/methylation domain-containing protein